MSNIQLTLTPTRAIGLTLTAPAQGSIEFVPSTAGITLQLAPFFKGDKGLKGDSGGSGQCLLISIDAIAISTKQITLPVAPVSNVLLDVVGGTSQRQNVDFIVTGMVLSWAGLSLELLLAAGDYLSISYT